jgi:glycosyltransferase involved in cell wall biosynthesis
MSDISHKLTVVISVHNEQDQLADCLKTLSFADEIVVVLDKCTDKSGDIAREFTDQIVDGRMPWSVDIRD